MARCIRGLRESPIGVVVNETFEWHISHVVTLDGVSDANRRWHGIDRTSRRHHEMEMESPIMKVDGSSLDQLFATGPWPALENMGRHAHSHRKDGRESAFRQMALVASTGAKPSG